MFCKMPTVLFYGIIFCVVQICYSDSRTPDFYQDEDVMCPLTCICTPSKDNSTLWEVRCVDKHYWTKIPPLPRNTTFLTMIGCNLQALKNRTFFKASGKELRTLILKNDNITSIAVNAFQNLISLEELILSGNRINSFPNETFVNATNLTKLILDKNLFEVIPAKDICLMKKLTTLSLVSNKIKTAKIDECFTKLTDLTTLDLSDNPITQINTNDFDALKNAPIANLNLGYLGLTRLSKDVFKNLPHLENLLLAKNNFTFLPPDIFQYTPALMGISLEVNRLKVIPNSALSRLTCLRNLDVGHNTMTHVHFYSEFQQLLNMTTLTLSGNPLKRLYNDTFSNLHSTRISHLSLTKCLLYSIEADAFLPLKSLKTLEMDRTLLNAQKIEKAFYGLRFARNLSTLNLHKTYLVGLTNKTFQYLANTSVIKLRVGMCKIKTIQTGTFKYFPKLQYLDLSNNRINVLQARAFGNLGHLVRLILSNNRLPYIPKANLVNLNQLKILYLERNDIKLKLKEEHLMGYTALEELNLKGNDIKAIGFNAFFHAPNLRRLDLGHNGMRSHSSVQQHSFTGLKQLEVLILAGNNILKFDTETLRSTPRLQVLDMSGNRNIRIEGNIVSMFKPLRNLTKLYMSSTGLEQLPPSTFHNLTKLSIVDLSGNQLSKWDPVLFRDQRKLFQLSLANNKLTNIQEDCFEALTSLRELDISSNMFACECNILWLTKWIRKGTVYLDHLNNITCKSPPNKNQLKLAALHMEGECMSFTFYYICLIMLLFHMLIVTLGTVAYRLRWYLRYWIHLVHARKAMEREMAEERYVFDAFVTYAHQDMKWVVRELLPKLEYEAKIRLCLHQRNWLAGRSIPRNIIDSIEKSRKTVLVLSNSFARSKWGELEMSLAQHKLLTTRRETVVPILLEDINERYMTEQMVCLFATQTYVKWPRTNEKEQRKFWKNLITTLRPPQEPPQYDEENRDFLTTEVNAIRPAV